jgi:hypothetical protein
LTLALRKSWARLRVEQYHLNNIAHGIVLFGEAYAPQKSEPSVSCHSEMPLAHLANPER